MIKRRERQATDDELALLHRRHAEEAGSWNAVMAWRATVPTFLLATFLALFVAAGLRQPALAGALVFLVTARAIAVDLSRAHQRLKEGRKAAAQRWDPILSRGVVEHVQATATAAIRIDDDEANTAWFLQVEPRSILCVWDWAEEARESVEIIRIPEMDFDLETRWSDRALRPIGPKRRFKHGEARPVQTGVLDGELAGLDALLRSAGRVRPGAPRSRAAAGDGGLGAVTSRLEGLGFYKFIDGTDVEEIEEALGHGASFWFELADRAFDADAERLAEGGVNDLLDYLRPALTAEGVVLGPVEQTYDEEEGYRLVVNGREHVMWDRDEADDAWEHTTVRTAQLVNGLLAGAGSKERLYLKDGGEDGVFVLLTPELHAAILDSKIIPAADIPVAL